MNQSETVSDRSVAPRQSGSSGFTLVELLVTMAIIGLLAGLLLPVLARAKGRVKGVTCVNNTRQLMIALHNYSNDYSDRLPPNPDDGKMRDEYYWCSGQAGKGGAHEFNTDILKNPATAMLSGYLGRNASVYRCPGDLRVGKSQNPSDAGNRSIPAARSVAMNQSIGTDPYTPGSSSVNGAWLDGDYKNTRDGPYRTYGRVSEFSEPGPANTWVFIDESSFNLNDAAFAVSMVGAFWLDFPGRYHNTSSGLAFMDGHSEYHKWTTPHLPSKRQEEAKNPDWGWLRDRTSAKR